MFTSARIKLTTWYLLIIMAISLSFSLIIYNGVRTELRRRFIQIETRLNLNPAGNRANRGQVLATLLEDYNEARARVIIILAYTNGAILVFSAGAGYYLAGKTLHPIESALEEQKRFVADASHELRTPLTALQTSIEVTLRDKKLTVKDAKTTLRESLEDIENLQSLTNNLLLLARSQERSNIVMEKVDLKGITSIVIKKLKPLAEKQNIKIVSQVKKVSVMGDEEQIKKLVTILLDNAIKYSNKKGKITLITTTSRNYVKLSIKDTGIGISKEDLPHIFNRFYRADTSRTKKGSNGYGLGLCLAKRIVDDHGGKISAVSMAGNGSTFTVKLPR